MNTEINMLNDRNQIYIAEIVERKKDVERILKSCTCNGVVEYINGIKPG